MATIRLPGRSSAKPLPEEIAYIRNNPTKNKNGALSSTSKPHHPIVLY
jgi:hypothetical protein